MNPYSRKPSLPTPDSRTASSVSAGGRARSLTAPSSKFALGDDCLPSISDFRASQIFPGFSSTFPFKVSVDADVEGSEPARPTTSIGPKGTFQHRLGTRHPNGHLRSCSDSPATSPDFRRSQERGSRSTWRGPASPDDSGRTQNPSARTPTVMDRARYETAQNYTPAPASIQTSSFRSRTFAHDRTGDCINQIAQHDTAEPTSGSFGQEPTDASALPPSTVPNFLGDTSFEAAFADTSWSFDMGALDIGTFLAVPIALEKDGDPQNGEEESVSVGSSYHEKAGVRASKLAAGQGLDLDAPSSKHGNLDLDRPSSKHGKWSRPDSQSVAPILDISAYRRAGLDEPVPSSVQEMEHLAVSLRPTSQHHPDETLSITTNSTSTMASTIAGAAFDQIDVTIDDIILIQNSLVRAASLRLRTEAVDPDLFPASGALDAAANEFVYSASSEGPFNPAWDELSRPAPAHHDMLDVVAEAVPHSLNATESALQTQPQLGIVVPPTASRSIFVEHEISSKPSNQPKEQPSGAIVRSPESKHRNLSVAVPPRILKYQIDHEGDDPNSDDDEPLAHRVNPQGARATGGADGEVTGVIASGPNVGVKSSRDSLLIRDVRDRATLATLALKQGQGRQGYKSVRKTYISGPTLMPDPISMTVVPIRNPDAALTQSSGSAKQSYQPLRSSSQPLKIKELGTRFKSILKKRSRDCVALLNGDEVTPFQEHEQDSHDAVDYRTNDDDDTTVTLVEAEALANGHSQRGTQPRGSFYALKPASRSSRSLVNLVGKLRSRSRSEGFVRSFEGPTHLATIPGSPYCAVEPVEPGTPQGHKAAEPEPHGRAPTSYDINSRRPQRYYRSEPHASATMPVPADDEPSHARSLSGVSSSYGEDSSISSHQGEAPSYTHLHDDTDALYGAAAEAPAPARGESKRVASIADGASPLGDWADADYMLGILENDAGGSPMTSRRDASSEHPDSIVTSSRARSSNSSHVDIKSRDSATPEASAHSTRSCTSTVAAEDLPCFTVSEELDTDDSSSAAAVAGGHLNKPPRSPMSLAAPLTSVDYRNSGYAESFYDLYAQRSADRATFTADIHGDPIVGKDGQQSNSDDDSSDPTGSLPDRTSPAVKNHRNLTFWKMVGDLRHSRQSIDSSDHDQFNFDSRPPSMIGSDMAESIMDADLENARMAFDEAA
ncbi:BZ3500_MvSof-1268-A1-R1_Chr4-2g07200 [Microbotryum saponariae]|uniref:BZ3500_MvSof-1268-A1-R1_Chr4-2g07200 protein n=1 Tax=Microbotryum saponariae TaxID=289078 RepID=A0A2X0MCA9_9BASI|nr:BZ3500_MvSof-1268-A1-R1_Chr4-2g07200 [Microbotryum saponariae]SDA06865.1 BZ3501_MvSof-1269-A2-R1_Chr4-2g06911 [Microbotryum saponariae]